jgi:RNA polymerase sigma factor (sigma-70 family)
MAATLLARCGGLEPSAAHLALIRAGRERRHRAWETACEQLLDAWETTLQGMARHYAPRRDDRPDFAQVARLALLRAARCYRHLPGRRFENYARRTLRNALLDEARRAADKRPDECRPCPRVEESVLTALVRREARGVVRQRLRAWSRRLQVLVDYLYYEDLTQVQAARNLGLTPARVNQLLQAVLEDGRRDLHDLADLVHD